MFVFKHATIIRDGNSLNMNFNASQNPKLHRIDAEIAEGIETRARGRQIIEEVAAVLEMPAKSVWGKSTFTIQESDVVRGRQVNPRMLLLVAPLWSICWAWTEDENKQLTDAELAHELAAPVDPDAPVTAVQMRFVSGVLERFEYSCDGFPKRYPSHQDVVDAERIINRMVKQLTKTSTN